MPEKPENEMDETLRAYARQRRDNPEVRIHPATRRMLQGEVKRSYGGAAEAGGSQIGRWWKSFWPYLAVTAVLAFIVVELVLPPKGPQMTVANKDEEEEVEPATSLAEPLEHSEDSALATAQSTPQPAAKLMKPVPAPPADSAEVAALAEMEGNAATKEVEIARSIPPPAELEGSPLPAGAAPPQMADATTRTFYRYETPAEPQVALNQASNAGAAPEQLARLQSEILTAAPPVRASSGIQTVSIAQAYSNQVAEIQLSNAPVDRVALVESNAQELAHRAWEARMRALAPPTAETAARRREGTSGPPGTATSVVVEPVVAKAATSAPPKQAVQEAKVERLTGVSTRAAPEQQLAAARPDIAPQTVVITEPPPIRLAPGEQLQFPIARMTELTNLGAAQRTWFLQATNPADVVPAGFLPNFNVERLGDELRFVDADGSVYQGRISKYGLPRFEPVTGRALGEFDGFRAGSRFAPVEAIPDDLVITNAAVYDFAVEGTNLTLGVPVTVRGKYVERTNSPSIKGIAGVASGSGEAEAERARRPGIPKSKAAIVGAAVIGGTNTVPFKALAPEQ